MKLLKRIVWFLFLSIGVFGVSGCESTNEMRTAYFNNITAPGSPQNTIKVTLQSDKMVDEKYFDIQVRSDRELEVQVYEENGQSITINLDDTRWNSLTTLMVEGEGKSGTETYEKYKMVQSKTYVFISPEEATLTFRLVVGEPEENSLKTGYILTNSKEVSNEFKLKLKKS